MGLITNVDVPHGLVTFVCSTCGQSRTGVRARCYPCTKTTLGPESRQKIRQTLTGKNHTDERRRRISAAKKRLWAEGGGNTFDLAALTRGKPSPRAREVGAERVVKDGRVQVKCADGVWRYRSRLAWESVHGEIPTGMLIHHHNENPLDDRPENLRLVTRSEHARIHQTPDVARRRQSLAVASRKRNGTY